MGGIGEGGASSAEVSLESQLALRLHSFHLGLSASQLIIQSVVDSQASSREESAVIVHNQMLKRIKLACKHEDVYAMVSYLYIIRRTKNVYRYNPLHNMALHYTSKCRIDLVYTSANGFKKS